MSEGKGQYLHCARVSTKVLVSLMNCMPRACGDIKMQHLRSQVLIVMALIRMQII